MQINTQPKTQALKSKFQAPQPTTLDDNPKDGVSINWAQTGGNAARGALYSTIGALAGQVSPTPMMGIASAVGTGVGGAVISKNPGALLGGMLLSHIGFTCAARFGTAGLLLAPVAGASLLALADLSNQARQ